MPLLPGSPAIDAGSNALVTPDSEVQAVTITGSSGSFTLTFNGQTTAAIPFNATAASVQAALSALTTIGAGNVTVTQSGNVYTVTFGGSLANQDLPLMAGTGSGGTITTVNMVTNGNPGLTTDQRGFPRIVNGTVDIGAFESSGFTIAVTSGSGQSTNVPTAFSAPLVVTVTANNPSERVEGGQVTFAPPTSGASATLSGNPATISATGTASVTATANSIAGSYAVSATASGITTPASFSLTNAAATATHFTVIAPATTTAGSAFSVTVTAYDLFGNIATGYTGTVRFTASDPGAGFVVPVNSTLVNGTGTFTNAVVLVTAGNWTVSVTDTFNSSITSTASIVVTPATTSTVVISSANPSVVGQAVTFKATVTNTSSGSSAVPTGMVSFFDGATTLGTVNVVSGQATLTTSALSLGSHTIHAVYSNSDGNFLGSTSANLTQTVQTVAVEPDPSNPALTDLFIGSPGATSNDQVQVNPVGSSTTGGTGVKVQTTLNGVNTQTTYSQSFSTIYVFLQGGNDNVQMAPTLTINAVVSAGNGNDNVQLGNGNNTVTLGNGNDNIQAGDGTNTVMAGAAGSLGSILVQLGNGANNLVTLRGNGNDLVQVGNGAHNTVSITGNGNDQVQAGNGNNDSVSITGNGNDNIQVGNGLGDAVSMVGNGNDNIQTGTGSGTIHVAGTGNKNVLRGSNGWTLI